DRHACDNIDGRAAMLRAIGADRRAGRNSGARCRAAEQRSTRRRDDGHVMRTMSLFLVMVVASAAARARAQDASALALAARAEASANLSSDCAQPAELVLELSERILSERDPRSREQLLRALTTARREMRSCAQNSPGARLPRRSEHFAARGSFVPPTDLMQRGGSGAFDARQLLRMFQTRQAAFRACYERSLRDDRSLRGTIDLAVRIDRSGSVTARMQASALARAEVGDCVVAIATRFRFNPGPRGGFVEYIVRLAFEPNVR
nr:AgmX/PglI C-terminal domain-containing protein [Myxococcota bacterium]